MRKLILTLALVALSTTALAQQNRRQNQEERIYHRNQDLLPALILGTAVGIAISQHQQRPQPVYVPPQPVYVPPHPVYVPPGRPGQGYPHYAPRIMSSHEPCYYSGQMVQIFDQWGHSLGFDACRP